MEARAIVLIIRAVQREGRSHSTLRGHGRLQRKDWLVHTMVWSCTRDRMARVAQPNAIHVIVSQALLRALEARRR
jgi:hypothetical protein